MARMNISEAPDACQNCETLCKIGILHLMTQCTGGPKQQRIGVVQATCTYGRCYACNVLHISTFTENDSFLHSCHVLAGPHLSSPRVVHVLELG